MKSKYVYQFGVVIFEGKQKIKEIKFKNEKEMIYWIYKNKSKYDIAPWQTQAVGI